MALTMTDSQVAKATVKIVDKKGQPAPTDGPPTWSTDNSDMVALAPAADGLSCDVAAVAPLGSCKVFVHADADLGSGSVDIIGTLDVTITGGAATTVTIDTAPPIEQP